MEEGSEVAAVGRAGQLAANKGGGGRVRAMLVQQAELGKWTAR